MNPKHIKPLDTVRAFAAFLVLLWHWLPHDNLINKINTGYLGVNLFFVLSGFLITRILLLNKDRIGAFKSFYIRRSLRILPLYYFVLVSLIILVPVKYAFGDGLLSLLTFTNNLHVFKTGIWEGVVYQFWTLSVEEQFYLVWPLVILLTPKKFLLYVILIFIAAGIFSQIFFSYNPLCGVLTLTCFDAFGIGALLSWLITMKKVIPNKYLWTLATVSLIMTIGDIYHKSPILRTVESIGFFALIALLIKKESVGGKVYKILFCNRVAVYFGKISYGIYVYHILVKELFEHRLRLWNENNLPGWYNFSFFYILFAEYLLILVIIASVSYYFIESPFLKLKAYIPFPLEKATL